MDGIDPGGGAVDPCFSGSGVCDTADEAVNQIEIQHCVVLAEVECVVGYGAEVCEVAWFGGCGGGGRGGSRAGVGAGLGAGCVASYAAGESQKESACAHLDYW